jgi:hypothetical protein
MAAMEAFRPAAAKAALGGSARSAERLEAARPAERLEALEQDPAEVEQVVRPADEESVEAEQVEQQRAPTPAASPMAVATRAAY